MNQIAINALRVSIAGMALLSAVGCASNKALEEVRTIAQRADQNATAAQNSANAAATSASNASNTANAAKSAADAAQSTANQALQAAHAAQAGVDASNEKIDRMFKKSVSK